MSLTLQQEIENIHQQHKRFFNSGETLDVSYRIKLLKALKDEIVKRQDDINKALYLDLKKSPTEAYITETGIVLVELKKTIKNIRRWMKPMKVGTPMFFLPASSRVTPEPYGNTLIISPWNYPFQLLFLPLIGAVAAGNTAVCKPSELSPHTTKITKEIIEAVFESNQVVCVEGGIPESTALLEKRWDYIFFTGSTHVGRIVYQAAAKHLTPVTLELGGKSPCIVDPTANLDTAASRIVFGKFTNAGQTCIAPDYLFVHHSIKEKLLDKMTSAVEKFFGKNPKESADYGRIINERNFDRISNLIDSNKIILGGEVDRSDKYIAPTFLDHAEPTDKAMQEEIFGPVLPIMSWNNLEEVKQFVKVQEKPLVLYMFSKSRRNIDEVLTNCSSGGVCVNDCLVQNANDNFPFGGVGESGIGNYHGRHSFNTFSHQKSIMHKWASIDPSIRYAPYTKKYKALKFLVDHTL